MPMTVDRGSGEAGRSDGAVDEVLEGCSFVDAPFGEESDVDELLG